MSELPPNLALTLMALSISFLVPVLICRCVGPESSEEEGKRSHLKHCASLGETMQALDQGTSLSYHGMPTMLPKIFRSFSSEDMGTENPSKILVPHFQLKMRLRMCFIPHN